MTVFCCHVKSLAQNHCQVFKTKRIVKMKMNNLKKMMAKWIKPQPSSNQDRESDSPYLEN